VQDDMKKEYTNTTRIQELVKNYSQFLSFPIYVGQERTRQIEVWKIYEVRKFLTLKSVIYYLFPVLSCRSKMKQIHKKPRKVKQRFGYWHLRAFIVF
jgi:HSP90 family molecular chaperone